MIVPQKSTQLRACGAQRLNSPILLSFRFFGHTGCQFSGAIQPRAFRHQAAGSDGTPFDAVGVDIFLECVNALMADGCTRHKDQGLGGNVQRRNVGCLRRTCGWVRARAHSRASEISATISSYLGSSNDEFDAAMVTLRWHMQIRPSAIMPCLGLQCEKVGLPSARNPRRRDHIGYASSARMGKLPFRLGPLQQPRQMLSTLSSR